MVTLVQFCKRPMSVPTTSIRIPYFSYYFFRKTCFTKSSLTETILHIVNVSSKKEMVRLYTSPVVTGM